MCEIISLKLTTLKQHEIHTEIHMCYSDRHSIGEMYIAHKLMNGIVTTVVKPSYRRILNGFTYLHNRFLLIKLVKPRDQ